MSPRAAQTRRAGSSAQSRASGPKVRPVTTTATTGRYAIEAVSPVLALGTRPAKAVVDERIQVTAVVVGEGHDAVGANVVLRVPMG